MSFLILFSSLLCCFHPPEEMSGLSPAAPGVFFGLGEDREGVGAAVWTLCWVLKLQISALERGTARACAQRLLFSAGREPKGSTRATSLVCHRCDREGTRCWAGCLPAAAGETCEGKVADVVSGAFLPGDNTEIRREV